MSSCGTVFNLSEDDKFELVNLERIAARYENIAARIKYAVEQCRQNGNIEGISDMVAMAFNAQAFTPSYGGGGANLPPGKYKGVIVDTRQEKTSDGKGGFLALDLTPIEGPLASQKHTDRLNLHNLSPKAVEIANQQLAAYCAVTGVFSFQDTVQLHNLPFYFEIGFQKGQEPTAEKPEGGYTEVKALYDINGNSPGKAGNGGAPVQQQQQPPAQPPAQVAPAAAPAAGWGGQAAPPQEQAAPPAQQPQAQPGPAAWGGPPVGTQQPPQAGASALPPGWG